MHIPICAADQAFAREFSVQCQERIAPLARAADQRGGCSAEGWRAVVDSGYLRLFHAAEWGGTGASGIRQALAMEALAQACAGTFWTASISSILCGKLLHDLCGPQQQARWLPRIVAGESLGCFAATERGAGSDPASYHTTVQRSGGGYRLCGEKARVSNATTADIAVVLARRETTHDPRLCYAVVDLHKPGVVRREQPKLGLQAMSWGRLEFTEVELGEEDVILDASIDQTLRVVEWGQLIQTMCAIGLASAALAASREYMLHRHAFGRPIAHLQAVHARLADMQAELDAARLLAFAAARDKAEGLSVREPIMMAKIYATEMAVRSADRAMRTFGGSGYAKDQIVERIYRDSLANVPAGLPTDRLREFIACAMVGADPWVYPPFDWLTPAGLTLGDDDCESVDFSGATSGWP